jgi:hypothetical protein
MRIIAPGGVDVMVTKPVCFWSLTLIGFPPTLAVTGRFAVT